MTGYAAAPTHVPGETIPSADWNILAGDINTGLMRMLADTTIGVAAASIDFTSIPATFAHLLLVVYARTDSVTNGVDGCNLRFNNDSAANYDYQIHVGSAAGATIAETFAATSVGGGLAVGGGSGANLFAVNQFLIAHYAAALNNKSVDGSAALKSGTASGNMRTEKFAGFWRSNAAVNRITLIPSLGNFAVGCRATLYGLPF